MRYTPDAHHGEAIDGTTSFTLTRQSGLSSRPLGGGTIFAKHAMWRSLAVCAGNIAGLEDDKLHLEDKSGSAKTRPLEVTGPVVFLGADHLFVWNRNAPLIASVSDLAEGEPLAIEGDWKPIVENKVFPVGSCGEPHAWLIARHRDAEHIALIDASGAAKLIEAPPWANDKHHIGTNDRDEPVFVSEELSKIGWVDTEPEHAVWQERDVPLPKPGKRYAPAMDHRVRWARARVGIILDAEGKLHVSHDAGRSFKSLAAPPIYGDAVERRVVCAEDRCELSDVALYVRGGTMAATEPPRQEAKPKDESRRVVTCTPGTALDHLAEPFGKAELTHGVGGALASGTIGDPLWDKEEGGPMGFTIKQVHVSHAGKAEAWRVAKRPALDYRPDPTIDYNGTLLLYAGNPTEDFKPIEWHFSAGPGKARGSLRFGDTGYVWSIEAVLTMRDGGAIADGKRAEVLWIDSKGRQRKRAWPSRHFADLRGEANMMSSMVAIGDDWIVAQLREDTLLLATIEKDGLARKRGIQAEAISYAQLIEQDGSAHMLLEEGGGNFVVRPLDADMRLGDAHKIAGGTLTLCGDDAVGTLTSMSVPITLKAGDIAFDSVSGQLLVTRDRMCLRSLSAESEQGGNIVVDAKGNALFIGQTIHTGGKLWEAKRPAHLARCAVASALPR